MKGTQDEVQSTAPPSKTPLAPETGKAADPADARAEKQMTTQDRLLALLNLAATAKPKMRRAIATAALDLDEAWRSSIGKALRKHRSALFKAADSLHGECEPSVGITRLDQGDDEA